MNFQKKNYFPPAIKQFETNQDYFENRYSASSEWIETNNHAVISNGPFFLEAYSPESRTISVKAFEDESYPFKAGHWSEFEDTKFPKITNIEIPNMVQKNEDLMINVSTVNSDSILYFLNNRNGDLVSSESLQVNGNPTTIEISGQFTQDLGTGANDLKVFALSNSVLRPDYYSTSFLVTEKAELIPQISADEIQRVDNNNSILFVIIPIFGLIIVMVFLLKKKATHSARP